MIFVIFIISFIGLTLFFSWKIVEINTGKRILSTKTLDKSDAFINRSVARSWFYSGVFLSQLNKIPVFLDIFLRNILDGIKSLKDKLLLRIVDFLNLDNVKNIERNKGSVSLFLKEISEDTGHKSKKEKKRK